MLRGIQAISAAIALVAALATTGCDEPKPAAPAPSAKPSAAAPSAKPTATAAAAPTKSAAAGKLSNCPNAVEGAATDIKDVDGGVEITVTAKDDAAVKDIRSRAKLLAEAAKSQAGTRKHSGTGEGGGALGRCPVVMRATNVAVSDVDGGSKIVVKIKDAAEVDWLRRESRERLANLSLPGGKEAGQGKRAHCPSAVDGAKTAVKKTAVAVVVTVTATGDDKVKDVRERAKHLAEASKAVAGGKHTGEGLGGGGFGRCPVVMKDTTVAAKDVDGGAELTVTPKDKAGLDALAKEAEERIKKLGAAAP